MKEFSTFEMNIRFYPRRSLMYMCVFIYNIICIHTLCRCFQIISWGSLLHFQMYGWYVYRFLARILHTILSLGSNPQVENPRSRSKCEGTHFLMNTFLNPFMFSALSSANATHKAAAPQTIGIYRVRKTLASPFSDPDFWRPPFFRALPGQFPGHLTGRSGTFS